MQRAKSFVPAIGSTTQKSVRGETLRQPHPDQLPDHQIGFCRKILWAFQGHIPIVLSFKSLLRRSILSAGNRF
jgi:hypothetical protein